MSLDGKKISASGGLVKNRSFGKVRCHNPSCMGRLEPKPGDKSIKCDVCGMEYRLHWVNPSLPRIRGPVWDVNRKIAGEKLSAVSETES